MQFKNGNGKYVKRQECHQAQDAIKMHLDKRLLELKSDLTDLFNVRFEDFKDFFLKNGKH